MLSYLITLYDILVRSEFCNDLINGLLVIAVIIEDDTFIIIAFLERHTACSEGNRYLLSLIRGQDNIFFIDSIIIVTDMIDVITH